MGMEGGASVSVGGQVTPSEEVEETQGGENNRTENRGRFF